MVTLLRRVATRAKAELSVERVDETKSEGDNSAWRPLLRPRDLNTFLRVTRGDQTMVLEVSVASGEGVVCGLKHEVSHPVHVVLRTRANSVVRLALLGLRRRPACEAMQLADRQMTTMTSMKEWLDEVYGEFMRTSVGILEVLHYYQERAKDWPSEWKRIKRGPAVCSHTAARETRRTSTFFIV